jgi:hypothetical protein
VGEAARIALANAQLEIIASETDDDMNNSNSNEGAHPRKG